MDKSCQTNGKIQVHPSVLSRETILLMDYSWCFDLKKNNVGSADSTPESKNNIKSNQRNKPVGVKATDM